MKKLLVIILALSCIMLTPVFTACDDGKKTPDTPQQTGYTITFDADGGSVNLKSKKVNYGEQIGDLPVPEKADKNFVHWYYESGNRAIYSDTVFWLKEDITVKAVYCDKDEYVITYALDGGKFEDYGKVPFKYKQTDNDISLVAPVKDGCTFIGWSGTGIDGVQENVVIPTGSTGNRQYTAKWRVDVYYVLFNLNFSTECKYDGKTQDELNMYEVISGQTFSGLLDAVPISADYKFECWYYLSGTERIIIDKETVFNQDTFGERQIIILSAYCTSGWSGRR